MTSATIDFESLASGSRREVDSSLDGQLAYEEDGYSCQSALLYAIGSTEAAYSGSPALWSPARELIITKVDGGQFRIRSIDLTEVYGNAPREVAFVGSPASGEAVTQRFTLDGDLHRPQTFTFDSRFRNLSQLTLLQAPGAGLGTVQVDNVVMEDNGGTATSLSVTGTWVDENVGTAELTVTRTGNLDGPSAVQYRTVAGTAGAPADFEAGTGTLAFAAGDAVRTIFVPLVDDTDIESPETFSVVLANATNAALADDTAEVTIVSDDARLRNRAPTVARPIATQRAAEGWVSAFTIPADTFTDPDGDALTLSARAAGGTALPAWLRFDAATGTFSGTAPVDAPDGSIEVRATDAGGRSAVARFRLITPRINRMPVLAGEPDDILVVPGRAFTSTAARDAFSDPDGDPLSFTALLDTGDPLPSWLRLAPLRGVLRGQVPATLAEDLEVVVTADDGHGGTASQLLIVAVANRREPRLNGPQSGDAVAGLLNRSALADLLDQSADAPLAGGIGRVTPPRSGDGARGLLAAS